MRSLTRHCCAALALASLFLLLSAANRVAAQTSRDASPAPASTLTYELPPDLTLSYDIVAGPPVEITPDEPQTYTLQFQGVQTSPGTPDYNTDTLVGLNYAGDVSGPLTGALSFSFSQKSTMIDSL